MRYFANFPQQIALTTKPTAFVIKKLHRMSNYQKLFWQSEDWHKQTFPTEEQAYNSWETMSVNKKLPLSLFEHSLTTLRNIQTSLWRLWIT